KRIRVLLTAFGRESQVSEFALVKVQPAKARLNIPNRNARWGQDLAKVQGVLMDDNPWPRPTQSGDIADIDRITAGFVIEVAQYCLQEFRPWIIHRWIVQL